MRAYDELVSYIALSAPATRRPGTGDEPFLRPEFGFTPKWYRDAVGVDFGERWHLDPEYRRTAGGHGAGSAAPLPGAAYRPG